MKYNEFNRAAFEEACLAWPNERTHEVHEWFDEPVKWPYHERHLPNAGQTADWGEKFQSDLEEITGAEQIRYMLNYMGRARWTPNALALITHQGDRVELGVDWYEETSTTGRKYWRPIEIVNGEEFRAGRRPWIDNNWKNKITDPEERNSLGLGADPVNEGFAGVVR